MRRTCNDFHFSPRVNNVTGSLRFTISAAPWPRMSWPILRQFSRGTVIDSSIYILEETSDDEGFRWFCLNSDVEHHLILDHQWEEIRSMVKTGCQAIRLTSNGPNDYIVEPFPPALSVLQPPRAEPFPLEIQQFYRVYDLETQLEVGPTYHHSLSANGITTMRERATGVYYSSHIHFPDPYEIKYPSEFTHHIIERLEAYHRLRASAYTLPIIGLIRSIHPNIDPSCPVALTYRLTDGFLLPFYGTFCAMYYVNEWAAYEKEIIIMHLIDALVDFESHGFNVTNLFHALIWLTPDGLKIVDPSTRLCNLTRHMGDVLSRDKGTPPFTIHMFSIILSQIMENDCIPSPLLQSVLRECQRSDSALSLRDNTVDLFRRVRCRCTTIRDLFMKRKSRISMQIVAPGRTSGVTNNHVSFQV